MIGKVRTNVKSPDGKPKEVTLGKLNLLVGPNESGKSTIAEAVQLAVSGSAYGLFMRNREVKAGQQLLTLAPKGVDQVFAEVEFEDGTTARWEVSRQGEEANGRASRAKRTGSLVIALPVAKIRLALAGSPETARKFLTEHLLDQTKYSRDDLEEALKRTRKTSHDVSRVIDEIIPDEGRLLSAKNLVTLLTDAGKKKREAKKSVEAAASMLPTDVELIDEKSVDDLWVQMRDTLVFEFLKKRYVENSDDLEQRKLVGELMRALGTPETLKALPGSVKLHKRLVHSIEAVALYNSVRKLRSGSAENTTRMQMFSEFEEAMNIVLTDLLKKPIQKYIRMVNKFLPKGDKFDLIHTEHEIRFGLFRNGLLHEALSGSTEARVLAAMGVAFAAMSPWPKQSVVIVEDRMWDTKTLSTMMKQLEKAPCQVILMTTSKPRGKARSEWTYIELEKPIHEKTPEPSDEAVSVEADVLGNEDGMDEILYV